MSADSHDLQPQYKIIAGPTEYENATLIMHSNEAACCDLMFSDAEGNMHIVVVTLTHVKNEGVKIVLDAPDIPSKFFHVTSNVDYSNIDIDLTRKAF